MPNTLLTRYQSGRILSVLLLDQLIPDALPGSAFLDLSEISLACPPGSIESVGRAVEGVDGAGLIRGWRSRRPLQIW
jgi:hypothetical protein